MKKYVAILRGINVSGKNKIKMDDLVQLFEQMGHSNVETYIQSGNVLFSSKVVDILYLQSVIEEEILKRFGFEIPVIVLSKLRLERTCKYNPYLEYPNVDIKSLHATFLRTEVNHKLVADFQAYTHPTDENTVTNDLVYVYCPNGYGKTKFNNGFIEKKLNAQATTRNWTTIMTLLEMINKN